MNYIKNVIMRLLLQLVS